MKKILILLCLVILALSLVGFALERLVLASPVIFVVAGSVFALFGILAVSPLVVGDPGCKP